MQLFHAYPNDSCNAKPLFRSNEPPHVPTLASLSLHTLPIDVLLHLMQLLDPVTQRCLGLTCKLLESVFHMIYPRDLTSGIFNVKKYPFGLNLQASMDGEHVLNWGFDDWHLGGCRDVIWGPNLGTLLNGELSLWKNLICCGECYKYKPQHAFAPFEFERNFLAKAEIRKQVNCLEREDTEWYRSLCKRCRVKILLIVFEGRIERYDEHEICLHHKTSLGLKYRRSRTEVQKKQELEAARGLSQEEYHAVEHDYETWSRLFEMLGV
jgi:hypothetical protein